MEPPQGYVYNYELMGFYPRTDISLGAWGFGVRLDAKFAAEVKKHKIAPNIHDKMQEMGKELVSTIFRGSEQRKWIRPPYNFWDDTCLLTNVTVPGDACGLDMDHSDFIGLSRLGEYSSPYDSVTYGPHNVDNMMQATALLAAWCRWYDMVYALIGRSKDEFESES